MSHISGAIKLVPTSQDGLIMSTSTSCLVKQLNYYIIWRRKKTLSSLYIIFKVKKKIFTIEKNTGNITFIKWLSCLWNWFLDRLISRHGLVGRRFIRVTMLLLFPPHWLCFKRSDNLVQLNLTSNLLK